MSSYRYVELGGEIVVHTPGSPGYNKEKFAESKMRRKRAVEKHGKIEPEKIYHAVMFGIHDIVFNDFALGRVKEELKKVYYLNSKERKRIEELIRSVFPEDYFLKRTHKRYAQKTPEVIANNVGAKTKQRSSVKHIRSSYLFLGLYLIAKLDFEKRINRECNTYLKAFERMRAYFKEKLEENSYNKSSIKIVQTPFRKAFNNFCDLYSAYLGSEPPTEIHTLQDYMTYDMKYYDMIENYEDNKKEAIQSISKHPKVIYWEMVLDRIKKLPNPLLDRGLFDFVQLLQINYTLTQDERILKRLEELGRKVFTRHISWRFDKDSNIGNLRWPNFQVYKDQESFLLILENNKLRYKALKSLHLDNKFGKFSVGDDQKIKESNWFYTFRYNYYPVYYWFFVFLTNKNILDKEHIDTIKHWLYLINESLYVACNLFGNRYPVTPHPKYKRLTKVYRDLNDSNEVLGRYYGWAMVNRIPNLPF